MCIYIYRERERERESERERHQVYVHKYTHRSFRVLGGLVLRVFGVLAFVSWVSLLSGWPTYMDQLSCPVWVFFALGCMV